MKLPLATWEPPPGRFAYMFAVTGDRAAVVNGDARSAPCGPTIHSLRASSSSMSGS